MNRKSLRHAVLAFAGAMALAWSIRADPVAELAAIHVEAIGGRVRIEALKSLRAMGEVTTGGKSVRFTLIAARPDRVRLETTQGGRTVVQASDGFGPAWELDSGTQPPQPRAMAEGVARTFSADAEFDDPLVAGGQRGFVFDHAGETVIEGRKLVRVLVTRKLTESFSLLIDASTYLIASRHETRTSAAGRTVPVVTTYADFRPVDGVLLPHQIAVSVDGRVTQQTRIERIEANPAFDAGVFGRP